jgi:hypothetical protein
MPKTVITEAPVDAVADGGSFPTMPRDISHVTFYFDLTPDQGEDSAFFFVKVETPGYVNDDLDSWAADALAAIIARNPQLVDAEFEGAAIKFGSFRGQSGGEFYYSNDHDSTDQDNPPTGGLVHAREYGSWGGGVEYRYDDLF